MRPVLVYRNDAEPFAPAAALAALRNAVARLNAHSRHDDLTAVLIETGEIEGGIVDALSPVRDEVHPLADALAEVTLTAGEAFVASWRGEDFDTALVRMHDALKRIADASLPSSAERRVSEGYAFYALHPETYAAAAREFAKTMRPQRVVCVGVRSIGTSLSAVVAAALRREEIQAVRVTVRPRGHPFDRQLTLAPTLERRIVEARADHFLIVDEGPGLSGSSFASVARALSALGVPDDAISFMPSWPADGSSFNSEAAREVWHRHRRWHVGADEIGMRRFTADPDLREWSGGKWRESLYRDDAAWPAAQPAHERIKYFDPTRHETFRFAGLGRYGRARLERAEMLADAGLGPRPVALEDGYLRLPFIAGRPCAARDASPGLFGAIARHLAFLRRHCAAPLSPSLDVVHEMIVTNVREADPALSVPALQQFAGLDADSGVAIDGRMLPHEWIKTMTGFTKTDALDHHADHFFPGTQDIAWDVAAVEAEFGRGGMQPFLVKYVLAAEDRDIRARLPFYRLAYAAFSLGYATMAMQSLNGTAEGQRFARRRERFLDRVRAATAG